MPNFGSQNLVFGKDWSELVLAAFKTTAGAALIATPKVRLSHDPAFNPTPQSTIVDLAAQEIAFSGYPAGGAAGTVSAPVNLSTQVGGVLIPALFVANSDSPFVSDNSTGYWIDDGTFFIAGERFPDTLGAVFSAPGDYLDLIATIPMGLIQPTS